MYGVPTRPLSMGPRFHTMVQNDPVPAILQYAIFREVIHLNIFNDMAIVTPFRWGTTISYEHSIQSGWRMWDLPDGVWT